ncbi:MAG: hypothetical protein WCH34_05385 [Bacteroidota bacterium]
MSRDEFLRLIREIGENPPIFKIRRQFLISKFSQYGFTIDAGFEVVNYYYSELKKAIKGEVSIYDYFNVIHNEKENTFGLVYNLQCELKMSYDGFDKLELIFEPPTEQSEIIIEPLNTITNRIYLPEINVTDFFNDIREASITEIEIHNTIEKITDNFKVEKLKLLLKDFEFFLFVEKEEKEAEYTWDHIQSILDEYHLKEKEIPYKYLPEFKKDENGKTIIIKDSNKIIDTEKLLFPYEFFSCYQFEIKLKKLIKESSSINANQKELSINQPKQDNWTCPVFALFLYFLKEGNYEKNITKKYLQELSKKYGYTGSDKSLNNEIISIKKEANYNQKTDSNLLKVIEQLSIYPKSKEKATNAVNEFNRISNPLVKPKFK